MVKISDKIIKYFLPLFYFAVAIAFYLRTYDSCQIKITIVHIGGTILIALWLIKLIEEYDISFFKKNIVILLPVILALCSNIFSHLHSPLKYASGMELVRKSVYFFIALIVMKEFNSEEKIKRLLFWLYLACFTATFYGIIQFLDTRFFPAGQPGIDPFIWRAAFADRIFSTFGNPNFFGDFLVVMGPILLAMFLKTRHIHFLILFFMTAFNVVFTMSKGAWIGFTTGFITFCILTLVFYARLGKGNAKKIVTVIIIGVLAYTAYGVAKHTRARTDSVKFRIYTWMSCWEMINTSPVIGTGIGTFYVTYPAWRRPHIFFIEGKHNTESDHPENEYLEVWYDEGTIGFGIFLWVLVMCLATGFKNLKNLSQMNSPPAPGPGVKIRKHIEDPRFYYILGFTSSFIGMLSHNFVCVSLRFVSSGVFLWLIVGLINIFSVNETLPAALTPVKEQKNPIPRPVIRGIQGAIVVIAYFLILIFRGYFIGDVHHNIAIYFSKQGNWSEALKNYNIVTQNEYGFIMAHYFMGNVFNDRWNLNREYHPEWGDKETDEPWTGIDPGKKGRVDPERSISKYSDVWSLAPNYVQSQHQAGLLYLKLGDYFKSKNEMDKARYYWGKAIEKFERYHDTDPIFDQNYYRLAWVYIQLGEPDKAEETYLRHLYTREAMEKAGNTEREWVSVQLGRRATSIPDACKIHDGIYHSFYWEDWGKRRSSDHSETYVQLGNLRYLRNDLKKAGEYFEKAVELKKDNITAMKHLALIYNKTGKSKEVIELWHKIREINPEDTDVKKVFSPR